MFPSSTVGRKILMAITGQFMIFYVLAHVLGNSSIYFSGINAYADGLRHWPFVIILWSSRALLFLSIVLHGYYGVVIALENRKARPRDYAVTARLSATFAGRTMIWTGLVIAAFLIYHLLHFTLQVIDPSTAAIRNLDALGRPDVFMMVARAFRHVGFSALYLIGVLSLGLHLWHGIQSSFQTWGANSDRSLPVIVKVGAAAAIVLFIGYAAIPLSIVMGILK
jgi:succinate dehydrogenase / fumarate reductase cytochrome b subunit